MRVGSARERAKMVGDWAAVATAVNGRMHDLGMSQRELSERSGVSVATLRKIQQGNSQNRTATTMAAISRALGWPDEHLRRIAAGEHLATTADGGRPQSEAISRLQGEIAQLSGRVSAIEARLASEPLR